MLSQRAAAADVLHGRVERAREPPPCGSPGLPVEVIEAVEDSDDMRLVRNDCMWLAVRPLALFVLRGLMWAILAVHYLQ